MVGMAEEFDAMLELIKVASDELQMKDPDHRLLWFSGPVLNNEVWSVGQEDRYLEEFAPNPKTKLWEAHMSYLLALRKELGQVPEKTSVEPEAPPEPPVSEPEEEIPF